MVIRLCFPLRNLAPFYRPQLKWVARLFKARFGRRESFQCIALDKEINFYFLIDISRCKMWFYYVNLDTKEKVLLKTYLVSLGRIDSAKPSGLLTPLGKYVLGSKVAIYKPNLMGFHQKRPKWSVFLVPAGSLLKRSLTIPPLPPKGLAFTEFLGPKIALIICFLTILPSGNTKATGASG